MCAVSLPGGGPSGPWQDPISTVVVARVGTSDLPICITRSVTDPAPLGWAGG